MKIDKRIVLIEHDQTRDRNWGPPMFAYEIVSTRDLGKTWTSTVWSVGGEASLAVSGGALTLSVQRVNRPLTRLTLDSLGPELPPWKASPDVVPAPLDACPASARADGAKPGWAAGDVEIVVTSRSGKDRPLTFTDAVLEIRTDARGAPCSGRIRLSHNVGSPPDAIVLPHDLSHGVFFSDDYDDSTAGTVHYSSVLACTAP